MIGQNRYDPLTGEQIPNKKFDPNTGEIIEQKYDPYTGDVIKKDSDGLTAKVILNSGDIIEGKLIIQDKNKVTIDSEILGKVSIDRIDIKSMTSGGIPKSTGLQKHQQSKLIIQILIHLTTALRFSQTQ